MKRIIENASLLLAVSVLQLSLIDDKAVDLLLSWTRLYINGSYFSNSSYPTTTAHVSSMVAVVNIKQQDGAVDRNYNRKFGASSVCVTLSVYC